MTDAPGYSQFARVRASLCKVYLDDDVAAALAAPRALYRADFGALVASPHYELKYVPRTRPDMYEQEPFATATTTIAWFRRPRAFSQLVAFPWMLGDELLVFSDATNAAIRHVTLAAYAERDSRGATGYMLLEPA